MKLGRLAAVATALGLFGSSALAGNGSNFWHYQNGLDYYFFYAAPPLPGSASSRCFPGAINHAPTKVVNALDPNTGTYASKIETIWFNIVAGGGFGGAPILLPYVCLWSNNGSCTIATAGGTAANWGLFTGIGAGMPVLGGPLNGSLLQLNAAFGVVFPNSFPLGFINTLRFDFVAGGPGLPSAVTIPEGSTVALTAADSPVQGPGAGQYWTGSVDDRKACSANGNSGLLVNTGAGFTIGQPFIATGGAPPFLPIEWGQGVSTIDAVVELNITTVGGGPSGLNAHAGMFAPYDAGNNGVLSLTGATLNAPTAGEIFGVHAYDDNNPFGGSNRLTLLNFSGIRSGWPVPAPMCPTQGGIYGETALFIAGSGDVAVPTGGVDPTPGTLSMAIPQMPRTVGKIDSVTTTLLANPLWTGGTVHGTAPFGINFPWYPAPVKNGGSSGNNGGFQIPIPGGLGVLVGLEVAMWQWNLNAAGTAVAKTANNGHSHSNIVPIGLDS